MPRRSPMKTTAVDKDEEEPRKIRSSRSKRRHSRRCSSTESESPPRKRSKKTSKRSADKKSKRGKVSSSSSRRRRRSPSPSPSLSSSSSSSPSSVSSSSSSERSLSPPPPRSRSRDVKKRKGGRGRDRERRKARRSTSESSTSSSRSRSKSRKRSTKDGATRDIDRDEEEAVVAAKKGSYEIESYEKDVSLEKMENTPSMNATNETEDMLPAAGGSPVGEDLELILRQKALENFRKFRSAAAMAGKTDNGATPTRKEALTDSSPPQNAVRNVTEARSAAVIAPFRRQASSLGARHPTESHKSEDCGNGTSPWMQRTNSSGMTHGAGSPQQEGSLSEETHPTSWPRSPQDGRRSRSVMQRLSHTPRSTSSVNRRLGSSIGLMSHVNAAPRIKSVVSIPAREGLDGSTSTPQMPCENSAPVGESSGVVRCTPVDISKAEGTNGDDRKTSEPPASNSSPAADGKRQVVSESRIEDKDGSQLQKKTFSRMHDGETVEVSYKVYIPKKTPALERRKLQR